MSITIGGVEFSKGSTIQFRSRNMYDTNLYSGIVTAESCIYSVARAFFRDLNVYHSNVAKTYTTIGDVEDMDYFLLTTEQEENVPWATEWVDPGSIRLVSSTDSVSLKIWDITESDISVIRKLLTDNGYRNTLI